MRCAYLRGSLCIKINSFGTMENVITQGCHLSWVPLHYLLPGAGNYSSFVCIPGLEEVPLTVMCDGVADCTNGRDETSDLCAGKRSISCFR